MEMHDAFSQLRQVVMQQVMQRREKNLQDVLAAA
jgi:hypothetical protein